LLTGESSAVTTTFSGVIQNGTGGRRVAFTKGGAYTQVLTGTNTYSGDTTVTGGTLSINNAFLNDTATVSVAAGAVLNLNHSGTDVVGALILGGVTQPDGFYGSSNTGGIITGTGKIQVGAVVASDFSAWASSKGLTGSNNGATQDPNFNGISNLLEYVLNGEPLLAESPAAILPTLTSDPTNFVFTFHRLSSSKDDTIQTFQYGSDFSGWTDVIIPAATSGAVTITPNSPSSGIDLVTLSVLKSGTQMFGRLRVEK